jgi:RNA polymerase sigma-70 factor (ECF subfamily)
VAEVDGAAAALEPVDALDLGHYHLFHAIRADLLSRLGRDADAAQAYDAAIAAVTNSAEQTFLERARRKLYSLESRAAATVGSIVAQPRLVLRRGRVKRHGEPAAAVAAY